MTDQLRCMQQQLAGVKSQTICNQEGAETLLHNFLYFVTCDGVLLAFESFDDFQLK